MTSGDRQSLRGSFDEVASLYERARPRYPETLFEDLANLTRLQRGAHVLEIGCGTGQATRSLAERGYEILCVELGSSLAAVARQRLAPYPNVHVITSSFETWRPTMRSFEMVFAATSWHWLDPAVRFSKAASVLQPKGVLAIVTTDHVLPDEGDDFFVEIQDTYNAIGEVDSPPPPPDAVTDRRDEIEASNLFGTVEIRRYMMERSYTAEEYASLLNTYSGHRTMPSPVRNRLYREIRERIQARPDKRVRKHYLFVLHVAQRLHG